MAVAIPDNVYRSILSEFDQQHSITSISQPRKGDLVWCVRDYTVDLPVIKVYFPNIQLPNCDGGLYEVRGSRGSGILLEELPNDLMVFSDGTIDEPVFYAERFRWL